MLKIGNIIVRSSCVLAPLAGISDLPFRLICRRFGCELAFVEMLNARSLGHKSRRTSQMLTPHADDRPLGVQILGCEQHYISQALSALEKYNFDILDFNAACPAKKVVRRREGAALMQDIPKLRGILKFLVARAHTPVTVKIRAGWDKDSLNAPDAARAAEDAGVSAVCVHGRSKMQGYSGSVNYDIIRAVKKAVRIPVIGSGDILSAQTARRMFEETGVDAVAVARGALGNPWIFGRIAAYMKDGIPPAPPTGDEITAVMREHFDAYEHFYGERIGITAFRKFFAWYTKGFHNVRPLRERASTVKTRPQMEELIAQAGKVF